MSKEKINNPNAFADPMRGAEQSCSNQDPSELEQGMTLRDYFAAKAINGILCNSDLLAKLKGDENENDYFAAKTAYRLADAMLKARK